MAKKPMTLAQALRSWDSTAEDIRAEARQIISAEARQIINDRIGPRSVIERGPDGKILVDDTVDRLALAKDHPGSDHQEGCISPAELFAASKPQTEADPIDGRPLRKGKTVTHPIVDWSGVIVERRKVAAYAAERGEAHGGSESAAYLLAQAATAPPWPRLALEWEALRAKPRPTAADKALIDRVEARLHVQEPAPFVDAPTAPAPAQFWAPASVGQSPRWDDPVQVYLIASDEDKGAQKTLLQFLAGMRRQGLISVSTASDCPAGANRRSWAMQRQAEAQIILVLVSSDAINQCSEAISMAMERARDRTVRLIPISYRPVTDTGLERLSALPAKPITAYSDRDQAWVETAQGIRVVAEFMRRQARGET